MSSVPIIDTAGFESDVLKSSLPVLVKFGAPWCPPCRRIGPELDAVAGTVAGRARVVEVDVDEEPEIASRYGIASIPAVLVFKEGRVVDQFVGFAPREVIARRLESHLS